MWIWWYNSIEFDDTIVCEFDDAIACEFDDTMACEFDDAMACEFENVVNVNLVGMNLLDLMQTGKTIFFILKCILEHALF